MYVMFMHVSYPAPPAPMPQEINLLVLSYRALTYCSPEKSLQAIVSHFISIFSFQPKG